MPKKPLLAKRIVSFCILCVVLVYSGVMANHLYCVVQWQTDMARGSTYLTSHDYEKAIASLQDALHVSAKLGDKGNVHANASTHEKLGEAYRRKGEFTLAATEYRAAFSLDGRASDGLKRALAHDPS